MKKNRSNVIALFYPYRGAVFSNPTLLAFFSACERKNIKLILFTPIPKKRSTSNHANVTQYYHPSNPKDVKSKIIHFFTFFWTKTVLLFYKPTRYIGVDPSGLIEAEKFSGQNKLGYFSFEILFKDELELQKDKAFKKAEELASKKVDFILVQDKMRLEHLVFNNSGLSKKINSFLIPVAPIETEERIAFPPEDKVKIIFSGSFASWSGLDFILDSIENENWHKRYHVTFHSRLEMSKDSFYLKRIEDLKAKGYSVTFSAKPFYDQISFLKFLQNFHIGLGFYFASTSIFTKKNITEIGLASGKLNTYAMVGIPAITNYTPFLDELNRQYNFGELLQKNELLYEKINRIMINWLEKSNGAKTYYDAVLNPDKKIEDLVDYLSDSVLIA